MLEILDSAPDVSTFTLIFLSLSLFSSALTLLIHPEALSFASIRASIVLVLLANFPHLFPHDHFHRIYLFQNPRSYFNPKYNCNLK
nr:MAG TPA: hypothetical protein [Caudoviricetes sp.]